MSWERTTLIRWKSTLCSTAFPHRYRVFACSRPCVWQFSQVSSPRPCVCALATVCLADFTGFLTATVCLRSRDRVFGRFHRLPHPDRVFARSRLCVWQISQVSSLRPCVSSPRPCVWQISQVSHAWGVLFDALWFSVEQVVCCKLTDLQETLYRAYVNHYSSRLDEESDRINPSSLSSITQLKKLCNRE